MTYALPTNAALPAAPQLRCSEACRCPGHLLGVAAQFRVESEPRYQPRDGNTFCNIFVWDVTSALGAEVPHWVDDAGNPCAPGHGRELSANALCDWLESDAALERGWRTVGSAEAELEAGEGRPVVATLRNQAGHGHVAILLPSLRGPRIAQAGAHNMFDAPLARGFGATAPTFFAHR